MTDRSLVPASACLGAVRGAEFTVRWSACLSAAKVPPREPDMRLQRGDDDAVRGVIQLYCGKGSILLFISRVLTLHGGGKLKLHHQALLDTLSKAEYFISIFVSLQLSAAVALNLYLLWPLQMKQCVVVNTKHKNIWPFKCFIWRVLPPEVIQIFTIFTWGIKAKTKWRKAIKYKHHFVWHKSFIFFLIILIIVWPLRFILRFIHRLGATDL